jgi:hypothetical protein
MTRLVQIKLLHTGIWFFFAGCIVAIPVVGGRGHYMWAAVLTGFVFDRVRRSSDESWQLSADGHGSPTHRAALGGLRYLSARVAGSIQQGDLWDAVRCGRIVRAGAVVDVQRSVARTRRFPQLVGVCGVRSAFAKATARRAGFDPIRAERERGSMRTRTARGDTTERSRLALRLDSNQQPSG